MLDEIGRTEQAGARVGQAVRLLASPREDFEFYWTKGGVHYVLGAYDLAIADLDGRLLTV